MKKTIALFLVLCMAVFVPNAALASNSFETTTTDNSSETLPVFGYIGSDTHTIPPDPEVPQELEIYVEVPVEIMFAAFESDEGAVTSPKYAITNLSEINAVRVEIESFEQRESPAIDLDGKLFLTLVDNNNEPLIAELFPSDYATGKVMTESLAAYVDDADDNKLEFMVGGFWSGSFDVGLQPVFDMTIRFSAA